MLAGDAIKERGKGGFVRYAIWLGVRSRGWTWSRIKKKVTDPL